MDEREQPADCSATAPPAGDIQAWILARLAALLEVAPEEIDPGLPFASHGLSSRELVELSGDLERWLGRRLSPTLLYDHPDIETLSRHLAAAPEIPRAAPGESRHEPIAVIGMACRFPGADNLGAFWQLLRDGLQASTRAPPERQALYSRLRPTGSLPEGDRGWLGCFLDRVDEFDARFFGISPREAARMDPQQRLLLEVAWEALEHAGQAVDRLAESPTSVFVGISNSDYALFQLNELTRVHPNAATGTALSIAANRLSYVFNFRGASMAVDTACSSSLVALSLACQSLLDGQSELALAAGVNLILGPHWTIGLHHAGMLSVDGRCKTFDAGADGYVRGEGCGVVVLKRLPDARRDGDRILAVLRGWAVAQDGRSNGLTAPRSSAQEATIRRALSLAGVAPSQVGYVEAHGTGTPLGDPVEVEALARVLGEDRAAGERCWIGSLKTNIGHLEAAAGIAGLIKVILCLIHREIPPHLHLTTVNPLIALDEGPLQIPRRKEPWSVVRGHRIAGVSSFGFGGTLAHVIVEEPPEYPDAESRVERSSHVLAISAKSESALRALAARYIDFFENNPSASFADVCFSANTGRSHFSHRFAVASSTAAEARDRLALFLDEGRSEDASSGEPREQRRGGIVFLFSGQGTQYPGMGRLLYETQPVFRSAVDRCADILRPYLERPLLSVMHGDDPASLRETCYAQTALFTLEFALAELWRSWGVVPDAVMGHSVGEYAAACVAGVFELELGLSLVAERALLMQRLPQNGIMAVVFAGVDEVANALSDHRARAAIAAVNGPASTVISGARGAIEETLAALHQEGIESRLLDVSHAFHSPLMSPILEPFADKARAVRCLAPRIPMISGLTGRWFEPGNAPCEPYWSRHIEAPVRFAEGMRTLDAHGYACFLEIGPSVQLLALGRQSIPASSVAWLPSLQRGRDDWQVLTSSLAGLYARGQSIDWRRFDSPYKRRRLSLPTYPFEERSYWIEPTSKDDDGNMESTRSDALGRRMEQHGADDARRPPRSIVAVRTMIAGLLAMDPSELDTSTRFLDLGADSMVLLNALRGVEHKFGIKISVKQLFEELATVDRLSAYIDERLPPLPPAHDEAIRTAVAEEDAPNEAPEASMLRLMEAQLSALSRLTTRQLEILEQRSKAPGATPRPPEPEKVVAAVAFAPYDPSATEVREALQAHQRAHLDKLIARYCERTRTSKRIAGEHRTFHADVRSSMNFNPVLKEMIYPIVVERSLGSRLWDIDGNEYIDLTMGFGVTLLGHGHPTITEAIREQMNRGIHLGPQSDIAHEVAELICELTGMERVTFSNTGTEAVMTALRLARAVTGRAKIALFAGSYHGMFDGVLAAKQALDGQARTVPASLGVPEGMIRDVIVLSYDQPRSLDELRAHAHELAAILVEPVQSRHPDLQPTSFLKALRHLSQAAGAALIFDEVITGFRVHPGGAQALFGVQADIVTYGKVLGGGMPIGVIAGRARFMDAIDGGSWRFGDTSGPHTKAALYAGTFCKHPLGMAAARAMLRYLKAEGPAFQERLNTRTAELCAQLNGLFADRGVSLRVESFGSMFRFSFPLDLARSAEAAIFFYHLGEKGIYIWEGRTSFLSAAHTSEDLRRVVQAVEETLNEMQSGGFLARVPRERRVTEGSPLPAFGATFPLTEAQQQLWVLAQLGQGGFESTTLELEGKLDIASLRRAFERVVARHEALRTVIDPGGERQHVLPSPRVDLPLIDFSWHAPEERERAVAAWLQKEARRPFDLAKGPLLRMCVLELEERCHLLVLTTHHIVMDGWSSVILLRELIEFYDAEAEGRTRELPPPMQFREYATWLAEHLKSQEIAADETYWLSKWSNTTRGPDLPMDRPRPRVKSYRGARRTRVLPASMTSALETFAGRLQCTPFMALLAAYTLLLHRMTSLDEVITGFPVSGRARVQGERLMGYCSHLITLRSRLDGAPTIREYLASLKRELLEGYEHQDYPFARLINRLNPPRDAARPPLVTVTFNMEPFDLMPSMHGVDLKLVPSALGYTGGDLHLNVTRLENDILVHADYDSDLFEPSTIDRLLERYELLLEEMIRDPEGPARTRARCIHELFEEQASRAPDDIALVVGEEVLTYAELDARANALAHELRRLGVRPEVRVALYLERSADMVVGMLGTWKAGGAYVPLDLQSPKPRLARMLDDAGAAVVLTHTALVKRLPPFSAHRLCLDAESVCTDDRPRMGQAPCATAANLAYILYTSGSTGQPKGVAVEHAQLFNYLQSILSKLRLPQGASYGMVSTFAADLCQTALLPALCTGGRLVISPALKADSHTLADYFARHPIDVLKIVPSHLAALLASERGAHLLPRKALILGGEPSGWELIDRIRALAPQCMLYNHYGPTEATVGATVARIDDRDPSARSATVPVGRALEQVRVTVLSSDLEPAPPGVVGELYIGGCGVTRGYVGAPGETAARFLPDPFSDLPGSRLYRTGDLARLLPNGELEILGRIDEQVKIRGYRIELREIESVLERNPAVQRAVVVPREDEPGRKQLVAYVATERAYDPGLRDELRAHAAEMLPDYMLPAIVALEALPLTSNGKVDRHALPPPDSEGRRFGRIYIAPRNEVETLLAEIWAELLKVDRIGIYDELVEFGGDSILQIQAVAQAMGRGVEFDSTELIGCRTIADFARHATLCESRLRGRAEEGGRLLEDSLALDRETWSALSSDRGEIEDIYPLTSMQQAFLLHSVVVRSAGDYLEQKRISLPVPLDLEAFERAWREVVRNNPALRTSFAWEGRKEPLQIVHRDAPLDIALHDLRVLSPVEREARLLAHVEAARRGEPMDMTRPSSMRLELFRFGEDAYELLWSYHQLLLDGWSTALILREVQARYRAICEGRVLPPTRRRPFRDYVEWQRREPLDRAEAYFRRVLQGYTARAHFRKTASHAQREAQSEEYRQIVQSLPSPLTTALTKFSRKHRITLNTVIQGAWALLLGAYSRESDVVFGAVVSGRQTGMKDIDVIVGLCINTLPVRIHIDPEAEVAVWLERAQAERLDMHRFEYAPLAEVHRWSETPQGNGIFDSILVLLNLPEADSQAWPVHSLSPQQTGYPLHLVVAPSPELTLTFTYLRSYLDDALASRLLGHFHTLLEGMIVDPRRRVAELPLLTPEERHQLLVEWNDREAQVPLDRTFSELFEARASEAPDKVAAVHGSASLTYGSLDRRAERIAHFLVEKGVGKDVAVPILADRGIELLAALLGIFKAGGAYLPLDPRYPAARLAHLLSEAGGPIVLCGASQRSILEPALAELPVAARPAVAYLEDIHASAAPPGRLPPRAGPRDLAYILFTSGSTGTPKGAMLEQRGMLNHLYAKVEALSLGANDSVAQTASLSFDISIWQLLAPLLVGGRVEIVDDGIAHDPIALLKYIDESNVTILELVPSLLRAALDGGSLSYRFSHLRWLLVTGEALPADLCRRFLSLYPAIPMLNAYGPTECSDDVTHHPIPSPPAQHLEHVPIGRPIANLRVYILDPWMRPVPVGVAGELCVGGVGVGRGYLNDTARTAEVFLRDPFVDEPDARLYRTGDLACYAQDGTIEFLGRIGDQVKIRGVRIELGEIEATLARHPAVREAVVIVRESETIPGDKILVAYVTTIEACALGADELRHFLSRILPESMIPPWIISLDRIPRTPNGKVDKRRLPALDVAYAAAQGAPMPPRTPIEEAVSEIWAKGLGLSRISIQDNFFRLGGHSLLATQIMLRIRDRFGLSLPIHSIFETPTIAGLAARIEAMLWARRSRETVELHPNAREEGEL